jgi:CRP-like cAMP-binding protein
MLQRLLDGFCKICPKVDLSYRLLTSESVRLHTANGKQLIYYEGAAAPSLLFILKGMVKCYYLKEDKYILLDIVQENGFACYPPCWKTPGSIIVEAMNNCEFLSLSMQQWEAIYKTNPSEGDKMHNAFLQENDYKDKKRIEVLSMPSTEEKLASLEENYPEYRNLPATLKADLIAVCAHTVRRAIKDIKWKKGE